MVNLVVAQLDLEIADMERRLLEFKRKRNDILAISMLPSELLNTVFEELVRIDPPAAHKAHPRNKCMAWTAVTHVCFRWRAITLNTSRLWSHVCCGMGISWFQASLGRSKQMPFSLEIVGHDWESRFNDWRAPLQSALHQTSRLETVHIWCQSLRVDSSAVLQSMLGPLKLPAPHLRSLIIRSNSVSGRNTTILSPSFLNNDTPQLQHLEVNQCYIPWTSGLLQGLTSLHIELPWFRDEEIPQIPTYQILEVLGKNPHLVDLYLDIPSPFLYGDQDDKISSKRTHPVIPLICLQRLTLDSSSSLCSTLLGSMRIPGQIPKIRISCSDSDSLDSLVQSLGSVGIPTIPGLSSSSPSFPIRSLCIEGEYGELRMDGWETRHPERAQLSGLDKQFLFRVRDDDFTFVPSTVTSLMLATLPLNQLVYIDLDLPGIGWGTIMPHLVSVEEVHIRWLSRAEFLDTLRANIHDLDYPAEHPPSTRIYLPDTLYLPRLESLWFPELVRNLASIQAIINVLVDILGRRLKFGTKLKFVQFKHQSGYFEEDEEDEGGEESMPDVTELERLVETVDTSWGEGSESGGTSFF